MLSLYRFHHCRDLGAVHTGKFGRRGGRVACSRVSEHVLWPIRRWERLNKEVFLFFFVSNLGKLIF